MDPGIDVDEAYRIGRNDVRITHHVEGHWIVSKYPIKEDDPGYPGYSYSSTVGECPNGPDLDAMLAWAKRQPWSRPGT